ncbi:D-lactaldehyde dehydrogenase [Ephemerocybe angulata]|uniref:D-lactaldehyde dehydrogenase n=1 Tax=Ephemerocybe angulata TaxID=980116 RepID=A0A8H6HLX5_9AGAR|nr:D-lactaldehyde dehydrogenase [Tulosesus angulatus]
MPAFTEVSSVLVTGGTGYLGAWVVATLLARGHTVKAVVRSAEKGEALKADLLQHISQNASKKDGDIALDFVVIADLVKDGAFDDAVLGVDTVVHVASPAPNPGSTDPQDTIKPAVDGTLGVLMSALRASRRDSSYRLKRIVITSSIAAVWTTGPGARTFSEEDWNTQYVSEVEKLGSKTDPMTVYGASKVLAEKAAWDFYQAHKSEVQWDIAIINPPMVFGPAIQTPKSASDLPTSLKLWWDSVVDGISTPGAHPVSNSQGWVDVRDIAEAHVRAVEVEEAGGERIIVSEGTYRFQEWLDLANKVGAEIYPGRSFPTAEVAEGESASAVYYDTAKEKRILGIKYHTKEETTGDTLRWAAEWKL